MLWTSDTPFTYSSLPAASSDVVTPSDKDYEEHRIRVLRLEGVSLRRRIPRCDLRIKGIQLGDNSRLDIRALSYIHGRENQDCEIFVNGKAFRVSQNLYDGLEVLSRDRKRWGHLWVDQICINNADSMERSRQVKSMGEIYRRAQEVVVWLGMGLVSDHLAVDLIQRVYAEEQASGSKVDITSDGLDILRSFIQNPYFDRLWAVQELVLGQNITVLVGDRQLRWDEMIAVYSKHIFYPHISSLHESTDECTSLQRISIARTQRTVLDIFDVINGFCKYSCTDARDHLFGLLGLLNDRSDGEKLALTVDYTASLEAVLFTFCYEMLQIMPETDQLFDLLVTLAHAMGFERVFYGGCSEEEILEFFRGAGLRSGTEIKATVRNNLQARTVQFQEAAIFLASDEPREYDMLSGKRLL